jgi:hypothetical protein
MTCITIRPRSLNRRRRIVGKNGSFGLPFLGSIVGAEIHFIHSDSVSTVGAHAAHCFKVTIIDIRYNFFVLTKSDTDAYLNLILNS